MGELFERHLPAMPFDWTGERLTSGVSGQVEVEHLHRYFLARTYCRGVDVLDLAAGEGYGSALLAQVATSVVGVEIDAKAVAHARMCYNLQNLRYEVGDVRKIPLPDDSVDRVVSFETIEHVYEQETFLAEVRRVLRKDGILICSSPDRDHYSPTGSPVNRYHVRELTRDEFRRLLSDRFANVQLLAQRPIVGSVLVPTNDATPPRYVTFEQRETNRFEVSEGVARPLYWLAVASDADLAPPLQSCYFDMSKVDDAVSARNIARRFSALSDQVDRLKGNTIRQRFRDLRSEIEAAERRADTFRRQLEGAEYHLARLNRYGWTRLGFFIDRLLAKAIGLLSREKSSDRIGAEPASRGETVAAVVLPAAFPEVGAEPEISVVILSFAQCDYTKRCIASIAKLDTKATLEVIVSDDCSKAPALADIAKVTNLRVIEPPRNLGFLRHANWAVSQSKGKYVLLLNNDTELRAGAIDALYAIAKAYPEAGLVGSKLIYPDGRLQEAGGIVWDDGSAWNYGHSDDPDRPEYNYVRDAGYVSGASLLVPRKVWDDLGGFDERYAPAYCEDSDLAFRVRERGLRVLYAPKSVVVHHEGISHGTDTASGLKAYQLRNTQLLKERWSKVLKEKHFPSGTNIMRARDGSRHGKTILIIDHYVPEPDRDAGSRTIIEMIRTLQSQGNVVKFWPDNRLQTQPYTENLQALGVEVLYPPFHESFADWLVEHADQLDLAILSRPGVAPRYLSDLKLFVPLLPLVYYGHDLHGERMRAQARMNENAALFAEADAVERAERAIWREVDLVTYPSMLEVKSVLALEPAVLARVLQPYCFDRFPTPRTPTPSKTILFVAGFAHPPNADGAVWFAREVLPQVLERVPDANLCIAGSNPLPSVVALASNSVRVTGGISAEALSELYEDARVAVIPLRFGAGVKLKVVEALHAGLPLVTTSIGAQGIPGLEMTVPVTDDPRNLAEAVVRLLSDDTDWAAQSSRQIELAKQTYSREQAARNMAKIVQAATDRVGMH